MEIVGGEIFLSEEDKLLLEEWRKERISAGIGEVHRQGQMAFAYLISSGLMSVSAAINFVEATINESKIGFLVVYLPLILPFSGAAMFHLHRMYEEKRMLQNYQQRRLANMNIAHESTVDETEGNFPFTST